MAINPPVDATQTEAWAKLQRHYDEMQSEGIDLKKWFADDENRVDDLTFEAGTLHFDLSKLNNIQIAEQMIDDTFTSSNLVALVVPTGDYTAERMMLNDLEQRDEVDYTLGLSNVEAMDGYMAADRLTPRQFAELADLDYELAKGIYTAYAAKHEEFGQIVGSVSTYSVPLMDMFLFVCDQLDEGYVTLDSEQMDTLNDAREQLTNARLQLQGDTYNRVLVYLTLPEGGQETYAFLDTMAETARKYYPEGNIYVVGNSSTEYDFQKTFSRDNSVVSAVSIFIVLLVLLEDSGYMARIAFVMDRLLRRIGLSGRSVVPMLIGFGCSVPAVMATRTLPSERDRRLTILLTPFMSCTAKMPVYSFFCAALFPGRGGMVMLGLYLLGIIVGIIVTFIYKSTLLRGEAVPFVMELPCYRLPRLRNVLLLMWEKARDFVQRAFTVIFLASIVIWFLQHFDFRLLMVDDAADSILAGIASLIAPVFAPLGFGDWRIVVALISGFMAKESIVGTLGILFPAGSLEALLTTSAAAALLVFCLLYTPCVAAVAAIRRELSKRWAWLVVVGQCVIAWICAYIAVLTV